ncbi:SMP-30/gluconolactonase/LRE family protein [Paenibacillus cymbidii]|uniref:SMP-30/gluconolactonase/LRE family protein n=1 Tax=Paenibacillus cymbidii TaxID=1639034 RepID=UPI0010822608|nr:SMP-30/gluconolactonase/LRE family protein [Paenibacillus cymbidii]
MTALNLYVSKNFTMPGGFTAGIEGPAVDREGNVYAVNYERQRTIGKVTPDGTASVYLELPDGGVGNGIRIDAQGWMYIADYVRHRIYRVEPGTGQLTVYAESAAMNQPNDIALSRAGQLFASDPDWKTGSGQIWRIDRDGKIVLLERGMGTTNGIEVSPDERTLYVNETKQRTIWAYDLDEAGAIAGKRLLIEFPDFSLDGMRCDIAGNLYVTRHGKGVIAHISPQGEVLREIALGGKNCTNVAFGGPDGKTCYVTVADNGNIEKFRTEIPGRCWALLQQSPLPGSG